MSAFFVGTGCDGCALRHGVTGARLATPSHTHVPRNAVKPSGARSSGGTPSNPVATPRSSSTGRASGDFTIVAVVLRRLLRTQQPHSRRERGRHVHDVLTRG